MRPLLLLALPLCATAFCAEDPKTPKEKDDKPTGPEHNVTLAEEPGVLDLLARAQKARAKAETDPEIWPECVKYYSEILKKYPNTVYLDRWEGPDKKDREYENGLYKSTRERVAADIASLPPAGLSSYRVINDPPARALYNEAQEQMDERKMELAAQNFFSSSYGDDALAWLAEMSYDKGSSRQTLARIAQIARHPSPDVSKLGLAVRGILAQIKIGDTAGAKKALDEIQAAMQDAKNGTLRVGHDEGAAALNKLKARIDAIPANGPANTGNESENRSWETYFGNASHNSVLPTRETVGLLKWSWPIAQLLRGPNEDMAIGTISTPDGNQVENPTINQHLTIKDGFFYLCDSSIVAAYPVGNPKPGPASLGGNALFFWPGELDFTAPDKKPTKQERIQQLRRNRGNNQIFAVCQHPYFVTVSGDRVYAVIGAEPLAQNMNNMWGGVEVKQPPNYLVAIQRRSGKRVWALESQHESPEFKSHSKADQEWLKTAYFVSAPTYESGMLYVMAIQGGGMHEAWAVGFDANTGQMQWRTLICSANSALFVSPVQPDVGLPVAVSNGTVYVNTNLGAVAAIDALSGGIKWIRIYDRVQSAVNRMNGQIQVQNDFAGPNPPILHDNLLIVTPQDSDLIYAYDIESGKRVYKIPRTVVTDDGKDQLKHVLGIAQNRLILSGANIHFYEIKSGKIAGHFNPETPVKGRGVVAGDVILAATEKSLLCVDTKLTAGKTRIIEEYKWEDPSKEEAGNLFVAGDVLYTVTRKYVNAYFVWQEMERKLKERISKTPNDFAAYNDLADVYQRIEKYDLALGVLDQGLHVTEASPGPDAEKNAQIVTSLRTRKFDAYFELGEHAQNSKTAPNMQEAYEFYKKALDVALKPNMPVEKPVAALRSMATNAALRGDSAAAIEHFQRMIAEYGDVVFAFAPPSSSKARLYAQARIDEIKKKSPGSYDKVEAKAKEALTKAGKDSELLKAIPTLYPNSDASASALLTLAQLNLPGNPALARQFAQRYLSRLDADSEAAAANVLLAAAFERSKMLGQAKEVLLRISNTPAFAEKTVSFDPENPQTAKSPPLKVTEWALARLSQPQFQGSPSSATCSLGNGMLKKAWSLNQNDPWTTLMISGIAPDPVRHDIFFSNQSELVVLSASENGKEVWVPRPSLPLNALRGIWAEHMLIIWGSSEVAAYDSLEKGKLVWRKNLFGNASDKANVTVQASHGRLVISNTSGLSVLDGATGGELWTTQVDGAPMLGVPACGDGFVVVAGQQSAKVTVYDLDTGSRRATLETANGTSASVPPAVSGDRIYIALSSPDHHINKVQAFDGRTGKLLWDYDTDAAITQLRASGEHVFAVVSGLVVTALKTMPKPEGGLRPVLIGKIEEGVVRDLYSDGDDLYVTVGVPNGKPQLRAYSIKRGLAFLWNVDVALEQSSPLLLNELTTATEHVVVAQGNLDQSGSRPWSVVLVNRKSGKRTWDDHLETEPRFIDAAHMQTFSVQLFDGGVAVVEPKFSKDPTGGVTGAKIRTYIVANLAEGEESIQALQDKLGKNPNDAELQVKMARREFAAGHPDKALFGLNGLLNNAQLTDAQFAIAYAGLAGVRNEIASKSKQVLTFSRMEKEPKLNGTLDDWTGVQEKVFDSWRDVYLASEETDRAPEKQSLWKGPSDLKVSFRGGYDDKNLYMIFIVNDDKHSNGQTEGNLCDLGDSITLVFDVDRNGGAGFRGESFKLGACLNNAGTTLAWRWVEHGIYTLREAPLEKGVFVARKESEKQTVYQFAIPLNYLTLKSEPGRKFGFSFAVHDQDEGALVEKSIGASPGVVGQAYPERFGEGVLQPKP